MAVVRANHQTVLSRVLEHVGKVVVGLASDEQLVAAGEHVGPGLFALKLGESQVEIVDQIRDPLRGDLDGSDAKLGEALRSLSESPQSP